MTHNFINDLEVIFVGQHLLWIPLVLSFEEVEDLLEGIISIALVVWIVNLEVIDEVGLGHRELALAAALLVIVGVLVLVEHSVGELWELHLQECRRDEPVGVVQLDDEGLQGVVIVDVPVPFRHALLPIGHKVESLDVGVVDEAGRGGGPLVVGEGVGPYQQVVLALPHAVVLIKDGDDRRAKRVVGVPLLGRRPDGYGNPAVGGKVLVGPVKQDCFITLQFLRVRIKFRVFLRGVAFVVRNQLKHKIDLLCAVDRRLVLKHTVLIYNPVYVKSHTQVLQIADQVCACATHYIRYYNSITRATRNHLLYACVTYSRRNMGLLPPLGPQTINSAQSAHWLISDLIKIRKLQFKIQTNSLIKAKPISTMMFQDQQPQNDQNMNNQIAKSLKDEQTLSTISTSLFDTIKFGVLVNLFNKLSTLRSRKKTDYLKTFVKVIFKNNRKPEFTYSVLRLILPAEDRERGNYGVKERNLAVIVKQCFNLTKEQYERLKHFKNPNYHQGGVGIGDFAICLHDVIKGVCNQKSELTVKRLNEILDKMVTKDKTEDKTEVFRELYKESNAEEIKWISRIILKDLKLNMKVDIVLNTFHPDGNDYFNLTNSVKETCFKLQSLQTSLNDDIALFHPIRPMLAGKRSMKYFQQNSLEREYFVQTKFDGERLQVHTDKGQIKVFSRNGVDYNHVYENMIPILKDNIKCDSCILDGEIIVLQKNTLKMMPFGLNKVVALGQDSDMQLCYKVFDMLWVKKENEEINLMSIPLRERKKLLDKVITEVEGKLEVVKYKVLSKYEQIEKEFKEGMERNEEGLMLKDPDSPYIPKERAMNWIKMKGDYIEGMTDTLDLLILGGYFGNLSYRIGPGGHWSDNITTFLLGVIEKIDPENPRVAYAVPFCKVGTGYSGEELQQLRSQLRKHFVLNDGNKRPSYMVGNWKPKMEDRPDCYLDSLCNSRIMQIKGAQFMASQAFGTPVTMRFPRVVAIRYDKDWNEAMKLEDLTNMQNDEKYTKNIRRKRAGSESEEEKPEEDRTKKKYKLEKMKRHNEILEEFKCVVIGQEKVQSHLFTDMQFFVFQLEGGTFSKHDVERAILLNSGRVVQNPMITTEFVVADRVDFKLRLLEKNQQKTFTFVKPQYIFNCVKAEILIPLSPIYLTVVPFDKKQYYRQNFDRFGDSYTTYLNRSELDQILKQMEKQSNQQHPIDKKLQNKISIKKRRTGKISMSFGINDLQTLQLKMKGNQFITNFSENPNSIILGKNVSDLITNKVNNYILKHPQTEIQRVQHLYENMTLV